MTKGRQMPGNSKVRRRLVFDDASEPADLETELKGVDYLSEARSEFAAKELKQEMILKGMKWNFNFEKEVAYDGPFQWFQKGYSGEWEKMETADRPLNIRKRKQEPNSAQVTCVGNSKIRKLPDGEVEDKMESCDSKELFISDDERIYKNTSSEEVQIDDDAIGAKNEVTPKVASKDYNPPGMRAKAVKKQVLSERARRRIRFE